MKRSPSGPRVHGLSAWVLWLALLLPLAQLAAAVHAYGHLRDPARVSSDKHLPAPCDTCVVAAALGSSAPGTAIQATPAVTLEHAAPRHFPQSRRDTPAPAAYRSRAPPALHA